MALMNLLPDNFAEIAVYGAIVIITLIGFIKCIYPLWRNSVLLNRGVAKLEKRTVKGDHPIWREQRFLGRSMRDEWQQFLLNASQLEMRGMPCDFSEYINEESVLEKPGHARLAELIPSLLTSLGILGTFIGLMQGLTSMNFSTGEETLQSIPTLLNGMRFAFATSVAGITCSLAFNMCNRVAYGHALKALDSFEDAFYELAMPRPLQPEVQLLCQKQDEDAKFAHMTDAIAARISASLESAVGNAMYPLTRSLDQFIQGTTQTQVEGLKQITDRFIRQMNLTLDGQLTTLGDTITRVVHTQQESEQNLQSALALSREMVEDAKAIRKTGEAITGEMDRLYQDLQKREQNEDTLQSQAITLADQMESLSESVKKMQFAVDLLTIKMNVLTGDKTEK